MASGTRTALLLSPHLDDVAFSCGGLAALLADRGWRVVVATLFTRSIMPKAGFALACQTDKGIPPDADYMALRREEDADAMAILGAEPRWMDLPEAPHRGYESAPALFAGAREDDAVWQEITLALRDLRAELAPDLVLAPQGLGNHVDHLQLIHAMRHLAWPALWYRDTPYAIRVPDAHPVPGLCSLPDAAIPIAPGLDRKIRAATAYRSQIGFQFGGADACRAKLAAFAQAEGQGIAAERFLVGDRALLELVTAWVAV